MVMLKPKGKAQAIQRKVMKNQGIEVQKEPSKPKKIKNLEQPYLQH